MSSVGRDMGVCFRRDERRGCRSGAGATRAIALSNVDARPTPHPSPLPGGRKEPSAAWNVETPARGQPALSPRREGDWGEAPMVASDAFSAAGLFLDGEKPYPRNCVECPSRP